MQSVIVLFVMSVLFECTEMRYYYNGKVHQERSTAQIMSWLGILRVMPFEEEKKSDAVSMIILVTEVVAIGSAEEISKISKDTIRLTTLATFYKKGNVPWDCPVLEYVLHPEYTVDTINTVALVKLEPQNNQRKLLTNPIRWPETDSRVMDGVLNIGFTDRNRAMELSFYEMSYVSDKVCESFYAKEKIEFPIIWPAHYICYKCLNTNTTCVNDAGMALVTNSGGNWTLLGMSTVGPGCSLPARFIEFFHYKKWIKFHTDGIETRRQHGRQYDHNLFNEPYEDEDLKFFLNVLQDTYNLRPYHTDLTEIVSPYTDCNRNDGFIIYAETGNITAENGRAGNAVYMLSHYDLRYSQYNCIKVSIRSQRKTKVTVKLGEGFGMDDIEHLIMKVPMQHRFRKIKPKIIFVKDDWLRYKDVKTLSITFMFWFIEKAEINIQFWGAPPPITTTTTTTMAPQLTTARPRRVYPKNLRFPARQKTTSTKTGKWRTVPQLWVKVAPIPPVSTCPPFNRDCKINQNIRVPLPYYVPGTAPPGEPIVYPPRGGQSIPPGLPRKYWYFLP